MHSSSTTKTVPDVGVYHSVPAEVYHSWEAASASRLNAIHRQSPGHMRSFADGLVASDSDAKEIGSAAHAAILEDELFDRSYAIGPHVDLRTKAGKEAWGEFERANPGKFLLRRDEGRQVLAIRDAVLRHKSASALLSQRTHTELSVVWDDPITKVRCKMRADVICENLSCLVDLKTTDSAKPEHFLRSILKYGYHRQMAFYLDGLAAHGIHLRDVCIIAAENREPYLGVSVVSLTEKFLGIGRQENSLLLDIYATCEAQDIWPFYPDEVKLLDVPAYYEQQHLRNFLGDW